MYANLWGEVLAPDQLLPLDPIDIALDQHRHRVREIYKSAPAAARTRLGACRDLQHVNDLQVRDDDSCIRKVDARARVDRARRELRRCRIIVERNPTAAQIEDAYRNARLRLAFLERHVARDSLRKRHLDTVGLTALQPRERLGQPHAEGGPILIYGGLDSIRDELDAD